MYIYMCIYIYIYMNVIIHIYIHTYIHIYIYTCIHIYTNVTLSASVYIHTCIYTSFMPYARSINWFECVPCPPKHVGMKVNWKLQEHRQAFIFGMMRELAGAGVRSLDEFGMDWARCATGEFLNLHISGHRHLPFGTC